MLFERETPWLVADLPANRVKFLTFFTVFWKIKGLNLHSGMCLKNLLVICKNDLERN